jgi:glutamate/aspartate transport system permease protein
VDLARSLPLVLVVFWFYFLTPWVGGWLTGRGRTVPLGPFWSAVITFTLFEAAYYCEIVRGGIRSIPPDQVSAGYALGLDYMQTMAFVVMPQAFRKMTPLLITQAIVLFQDTSLVYVISATDFLGAAVHVANRDGRLVEMYLFAASIYFLVSVTVSRCLTPRFGSMAWTP